MFLINIINRNLIVCLCLILGGVGGIISGSYPVIGSILTFIGIAGSLWSLISSISRENEIDSFFDAQARLLSLSGIGNIYIELVKSEFVKKGTSRKSLTLLVKALELEPHNLDALVLLSTLLALNLSLRQWLGNISRIDIKLQVKNVRELAEKGLKVDPNNHCFLDVIGILLDIEGYREEARKFFNESGRLRKDPYWHLLLATSYQLSNDHLKAFQEMELAKKNGAEGWLFNFYYGRVLNALGRFNESIEYLNKAYKQRGNSPELLKEISSCHFFEGRTVKASIYDLKICIAILTQGYWIGFKDILRAFLSIFVGIGCSISKLLWKVTKYIPVIKYFHIKYFPPDDPEFTLGYILVTRGSYDAAEARFRLASKIIPEKAETYGNLALCLLLLNRKDDALVEINKAIKLQPDNPLFKKSKEAIQKGSGAVKRILNQKGEVINKLK